MHYFSKCLIVALYFGVAVQALPSLTPSSVDANFVNYNTSTGSMILRRDKHSYRGRKGGNGNDKMMSDRNGGSYRTGGSNGRGNSGHNRSGSDMNGSRGNSQKYGSHQGGRHSGNKVDRNGRNRKYSGGQNGSKHGNHGNDSSDNCNNDEGSDSQDTSDDGDTSPDSDSDASPDSNSDTTTPSPDPSTTGPVTDTTGTPTNTTTPTNGTTSVGTGKLEFRFHNGQCTDWADARYAQLTGHHVSWSGDARTWASAAKKAKGWTVSPTPKQPSIIVLQPGVQGTGSAGHVAVVEKILSPTSVSTSNYNYNGGPYIKKTVTFKTGNGVDFIWYT